MNEPAGVQATLWYDDIGAGGDGIGGGGTNDRNGNAFATSDFATFSKQPSMIRQQFQCKLLSPLVSCFKTSVAAI